MKETRLKELTLSYLKYEVKAYAFKVHGSKFMEPGIPDIVACIKGNFVGIELKRPGAKNEQSDHQKIHESNIRKSEGYYLLADNLQEIKEFVEKIINE